jgi:hypothetical protein
VFPTRILLEDDEYAVAPEYRALLNDLINYIKSGVRQMNTDDKRKQRYLYWDLLALMRGVMSSPESGISMLQNKLSKTKDDSVGNTDDEEQRVFIFNDQLKDLLNADDVVPEAYETVSLTDKNKFRSFIKTLEHIKKTDTDNKVKAALDAARILNKPLSVASWRYPDKITALLNGEAIGTRVLPE